MRDGGRRILANTAYRAIADLGSKLASLVLLVVMARRLGDAGFGVFSFSLALVTLVTALADFGQDRVLTREVARSRDRLGLYFPNFLALKTILALPAVAFAVLVATLFGTDSETRAVIGLLGAGVAAELLTQTCFATFQAYERHVFIPIALISQRLATAAVGIAALLLGAGVVAVAAIYLVGAILAFALAAGLLLRYVSRPQLRLRPRTWWTLMRVAAPIGAAGVFGTVLFRVDTAMLAAYEPQNVVGDYGAAYRLFESTLFLGWSVGGAVYPVFSRLTLATSPPVGFVYERALKLVVGLTLPVAVGVTALVEPVIDLLYGAEFKEAAGALALLAPSMVLYPIAYIGLLLLVSQDRVRVATFVLAAVAAQNILGNLVLIPWLSLDGAALGTTFSQALLAATILIVSLRSTERLAWTRMLSGPVVASVVEAVVMLVLRDEFAVAIVAGAAVYVASLTLFERSVFPEDARIFWRLLRRRAA
jgi:O-antigen/teichoic acid export membrane protein